MQHLSIKRANHQYWLSDSLCLIIALGIAYFLFLGSYPLFTPDEGRYTEVAREMVASGDYITPRVNGIAFLDKPVLYYWLEVAAIKAWGISEWSLRFFPAICGVFGGLLTYLCGRILFDRRSGLLAAIILSTTPLYFTGAHYADLNLEVAIFISSSLLLFITAIHLQHQSTSYKKQRCSTGLLFASYFFAGCAVLTKGLIGLAFPLFIIGSWIMLLNQWKILQRMHVFCGLLLFTLVVLPWYYWAQQANPAFLHYFFVTQQFTRFLSTGEFNNKTPIWFYVPILILGIFPWTIFLVQTLATTVKHIWQKPALYPTELFLFLWFSIVFIFFSIPQSKSIGYLLPALPALALLLGRYLSAEWQTISRRNMIFSCICFIVMASLMMVIILILPYHAWIDLLPAFKQYGKMMLLTLIASILVVAFFINNKTVLPLFLIATSYSLTFLLVLTKGAYTLNHNTTKPLIIYLKKIIQPQDEVVNYFRFYQDVPLYLGKRITIVADWHSAQIAYKDNWQRELWYGMPFQNTSDWLINEDVFWQRFSSKKRLFVFVNENQFDHFKSHAKKYFYLAKYNDVILISNHKTTL